MANLNEKSAVRLRCVLTFLGLLTCDLGSTLHSAQAGVVALDMANVGAAGVDVTGPNAGLSDGTMMSIGWFLGFQGSGTLNIWNKTTGLHDLQGLTGAGGLEISVNAIGSDCNPTRYSTDAIIDSNSIFVGGSTSEPSKESAFSNADSGIVSADFGAGSFVGFRVAANDGQDWIYGYLEVTWTLESSPWGTLQLLSGAYESELNRGITTPDSITIPPDSQSQVVPGAGTMMTVLTAIGSGVSRRRRFRATGGTVDRKVTPTMNQSVSR